MIPLGQTTAWVCSLGWRWGQWFLDVFVVQYKGIHERTHVCTTMSPGNFSPLPGQSRERTLTVVFCWMTFVCEHFCFYFVCTAHKHVTMVVFVLYGFVLSCVYVCCVLSGMCVLSDLHDCVSFSIPNFTNTHWVVVIESPFLKCLSECQHFRWHVSQVDVI